MSSPLSWRVRVSRLPSQRKVAPRMKTSKAIVATGLAFVVLIVLLKGVLPAAVYPAAFLVLGICYVAARLFERRGQ